MALLSTFLPQRHNWRLWLIQAFVLAAFALIPVWLRLKFTPLLFAQLYVTRFVIFLPMAGAVTCWLLFGLPGFKDFRRDTFRALWALLLLALALWAFASAEWAFTRDTHPEIASNTALQLGVAVLFVIVVACTAPPRAIVTVLIFGVFWNAMITIWQASHQGHIGLQFLGEFRFSRNWPGISVVEAGDIRWVRPYGLLPHPNLLAGFFAAALPSTFAWITARDWRRWFGLLVFAVGLWALLLTFSRSAWIGFAVGMFAILPLLWRFPFRYSPVRLQFAAAVGLALIAGGIFLIAYRPLLIARTGATAENVELRSVSDRLVYASFAYRSIAEVPFVGVGIGNFPWRTSYYLLETDFDLRGDNVHQVMLSAWTELGIVGIGLTIGALITGMEATLTNFRRIGRAAKFHAPTLDNSSIFLLAGVIALTVAGLFDHYPWTLLHFQVAWWGLLAGAIRPPDINSESISL